MKKKKTILICTSILLTLLSTVNAVSVRTIGWKVWDRDVTTPQTHTQIDWSRSILDIIWVVNSYLRFGIWLVCFIFMIWNGFQLILARGNEKDMKNATNALIWCSIGLVSCLLAYIIVNIAIKLFN